MARPYTTRAPRRVPVAIAPDAQPRLTVAAPLNVNTPGPGSSPLAALTQALGITMGALAPVAKAREENDFAEGVADEQVGDADKQRAAHSRAYADGAFQTLTLEQYQAAESKVSQKASENLDHSLPIDQQIHQIDGWMKEELGPLTQDERAKVIFGKRYQQFIEQAASAIQKNQLEANAKAAQDATVTDVSTAIQRTGNFTPADWNEAYHRLVSQNGDPVETRKVLVGAVMQEALNAASRGEDYKKFRDMIPTEVTGPDGAKLPGPMRSPEVAALVYQTMDKAENLYDQFHTNEYAGAQAHAYVEANQMVNDGVLITEATFKERNWTVGNKPSDMFSPERMASIIDQSATVRAKMAAQQATLDSYMSAWRSTGRLSETLGAVGGPDSQEKLNDFAMGVYRTELAGRGVAPEAMAGEALVKDQGTVDYLAMRSAQEGVPYAPLRTALTSINPASPGDVTDRLAAYKLLKARNLTGMYLDDDSALLYEAALGAKDAGMDAAGVADTLRHVGDKDTAEYVSANIKSIRSFSKGITLSDEGPLWATKVNSNQTSTAAYIDGKFQSLAVSALARGLSPSAARAFAAERIQATHSLIKAGDEWMMLPNRKPGGGQAFDPKKATEALDWYVSQLPKLAIARGIPEGQELTIRPVLSNGNALSFQVFPAGSPVPLENTTFTLPGLFQTYERMVPEATPQARAAQAQARHRAAASAPVAAPGSTAGLVFGQ